MTYNLYTFGNQTGPIPLSELDSNFAQLTDANNIVANTVINSAQGNITSLGRLTGLSVAGNVAVTGPISTSSTLTAAGNLTANGLVATNMYIDNNSAGNAIVTGNLVVRGTLTSVNAANVTTNNLFIQVANNVGNTNLAQLNGAGLVAGLSDYATILYNTLTNTWQTNIGLTPISNIAGLNLGNTNNYWNTVYAQTLMLSGNAQMGNLTVRGVTANTVSVSSVSVSGAVQAGSLTTVGNIATATNITALNLYANTLSLANGNGSLSLGTLTANGLIYSSGLTTGNITATGNVATANVINSGNIFTTGVTATGPISTSDNINANSALIANNLHVFGNTTINNDLNTGGEIGTTGNITATGNAFVSADAVYARTGNVYAGAYFVGNGSQLSNVAAANIRNASGWSVTPVGSKLFFYYGPSAVGSLDSSGNFTVTGNVTAFGTP